jgi:hypothetical protein
MSKVAGNFARRAQNSRTNGIANANGKTKTHAKNAQ